MQSHITSTRAMTKTRVESINVSGPIKEVLFAGQIVATGFFKSAIE